MGKVQFRADPAEPAQLLVDDGPLQGSPQGLSFDQLGGYEQVSDSILYRETSPDVGLELNLDYILFEDGTSRVLLEDGTGVILMELDAA